MPKLSGTSAKEQHFGKGNITTGLLDTTIPKCKCTYGDKRWI